MKRKAFIMVVMAAAMTSAFPGCGKDSKPEEQVNVRAGEPNNVEDEIKEPVNAETEDQANAQVVRRQ